MILFPGDSGKLNHMIFTTNLQREQFGVIAFCIGKEFGTWSILGRRQTPCHQPCEVIRLCGMHGHQQPIISAKLAENHPPFASWGTLD
jgi:hypothetical protein